ncbi:MAG: HAD-IIA family hydrolase [Leptospirales bacterium]|nr:HAD-IIA family hydrolase [Leptospirales bacterium]
MTDAGNSRFLDVALRYRAVFFDAFGVLKNSAGLLPGALEALQALRDAGVQCFLLTNDASRSPELLGAAYRRASAGPLFGEQRIISSGLLAREFLSLKLPPGALVAYLGKPSSAYYIESAGLHAAPISDLQPDQRPQALAFLDDEGFDWPQDLNRTLNLIRTLPLPVVVANADLSYPVGGGRSAIAVGGLAQLIESISGRTFVRFGKPDTQIFSYAFARARESVPDLQKSEVLMVGDTLHTDILGANKFGLCTALMLSGNTEAHSAQREIAASGVIPDFICASIDL